MNVVTLIGNLATDVEVKRLDGERTVASFLLAVDRAGQDGAAGFFQAKAWNRQAELCGQYLAKGSKVGLEGRLRSRSWEDQGKRRTAVEVVASRVEFLDARPESGGEVVPFVAAGASA
jgi:single-strand DNA-binding protein